MPQKRVIDCMILSAKPHARISPQGAAKSAAQEEGKKDHADA